MEVDLTIAKQSRCNNCILPNSGKLIQFDEHGTCQLCNSAKQFKATVQDIDKSKDKIEDCIATIKERGKGRAFDCVVGVSGGRDSAYMLYMLTKKHNLRCFAAYYRTPFTSDVIDLNVRKIVNKLNVPLVEMNISRKFHQEIARKFVILWARNPNSIIANLACAPCKFVNREIYRIAVKNNIRSVVYGTNVYEAVQIAPVISRNAVVIPGVTNIQRRLRNKFKNMISLFKKGIELLAVSISVWKYIPLGVQSSILYISPHTFFLSLRYPHIYAMNYFYKTEWNESQCNEVLNELGWELPPGCFTTWRADCAFAELKNYMLYKTIGITYTDAFLSNMVRAGILDREQALDRIKIEGMISPERFEEACNILKLPNDLFR